MSEPSHAYRPEADAAPPQGRAGVPNLARTARLARPGDPRATEPKVEET